MKTQTKAIWVAGLVCALTASGSAVARPIAVDSGQWSSVPVAQGSPYSFQGISVCLGPNTQVWFASACNNLSEASTSFIQALNVPNAQSGQVLESSQSQFAHNFRVQWIAFDSGVVGTRLDTQVDFRSYNNGDFDFFFSYGCDPQLGGSFCSSQTGSTTGANYGAQGALQGLSFVGIGQFTTSAGLQSAGPDVTYCYRASSAGPAILGTKNGDSCTPLATGSVPEPTSLALLGIGLLGVGALRRRRELA